MDVSGPNEVTNWLPDGKPANAATRLRPPPVAIILILAVAGMLSFVACRSPHEQTPLFEPAAPKPRAKFVTLRAAGTVPMTLGAVPADSHLFTASTIVVNSDHPGGVAYVAGWRPGAHLRIGALDLAAGKSAFATVDLGEWKEVYQFAARPEGLVVAGQPARPSSKWAPHVASGTLELVFVVLDPSNGRVRWQHHILDSGRVAARLFAQALLIPVDFGQTRAYDWTTGSQLWSLTNGSLDARAEFADVEPSFDSPLTVGADPAQSATPASFRLAYFRQLIDIRTGATVVVPESSVVSGLPGQYWIIDGWVYIGSRKTRGSLAGLWRAPVDHVETVKSIQRFWSNQRDYSVDAILPCGENRLCLTVHNAVGSSYQVVLVSTTSGRELHRLPATVPAGGHAIGDRYVDPSGRIYGLDGALLGSSSPLAVAWWLTPGSLLGLAYPEGSSEAAVFGISTADGSRMPLGHLPFVPSQVSAANGYLVAAAADGFHAWQYAQP